MTGRLERGEHDLLAVGEDEQQQEHDRQHGGSRFCRYEPCTVIGRIFDLHGTPKPSSVVLTCRLIPANSTRSGSLLPEFARALASCAIESTMLPARNGRPRVVIQSWHDSLSQCVLEFPMMHATGVRRRARGHR